MVKVTLKDGVYWVGVVDWNIRDFHGYITRRGSSYNAYLITDEKTALVDTVKGAFCNELIEHISEHTSLDKLDYIIVNHVEMDHSSSLPTIAKLAKNAKIFASARGKEELIKHYGTEFERVETVKSGDTLKLGKKTLTFLEAPMLHWPDSMFTYLAGRNILMPNDAFGQHYATAFRFNDQVNQEELYVEALKYYANILTPFSDLVAKKIDEVLAMNVPVDMIAPSHGVIWRKDPLQIVSTYKKWASQTPAKSAVVLYDTMWHATRKMAEAIGMGLAETGVDYKLFHMGLADRNDVLAEIFKAKAVVIGSPTLNHGLLPTITPIMEDLKGLRFKNKIGAAFGSYGWSGESVKQIEEHLSRCDIPLAAKGVLAKWQPTGEDLENCRKLGLAVAAAIKGG